MRPLVLTQIRTIGTGKIAKPTLVRFPAFMQRTDMRLQLRMRCRRIPASIAHVGSLPRVRPLVVVFRLVGCERLGAPREAAGVGAVARVREEVPRELGALLEVFGGGVAIFPVAGAVGAVVDVGGFDVFVEGFRGGEGGEAEEAWGVLPFADAGVGGVGEG